MNKKKTIGFSSVAFEITRKCNFACEHCIRGDAQNVDMPKEVIDAFFDQISELQEIVFAGGEPLLNLEGMDYVINQSIKRDLPLYSLVFTSNGTHFNTDVMCCLERWAFYIKMCHAKNGTNYKGSVKICISRDEWHDKQLALLGYKRNSREIYEEVKGYYAYLDEVYDVVIADDGKEPINLGRAKALPAGKTMDIDEENITHKLCLTGECEDLCKTVRRFGTSDHPQKAGTLVNCMVWLLCDGRLVVRGNMPYDYEYKDIISDVTTSHDIFADIKAYNSRITRNYRCSSEDLYSLIDEVMENLRLL